MTADQLKVGSKYLVRMKSGKLCHAKLIVINKLEANSWRKRASTVYHMRSLDTGRDFLLKSAVKFRQPLAD